MAEKLSGKIAGINFNCLLCFKLFIEKLAFLRTLTPNRKVGP